MKGTVDTRPSLMRDQASSFDVARIVRELSGMIGARARKAYQPHYEQIVIRLRPTGTPSSDLVIVRGKRLYLSQRDRPMPSQPSQFAMVLRKHMNNSRLIAVEQLGFDRIIEMTFEHGSGRLYLIIELFRDGNVLLLDENKVIIQPLTHAKYASRTLKRGVEYVAPPSAVDPRDMNREVLNELLDDSQEDLIRTLAARGNLGRIYGSAVCASAGIPEKIPANSLDDVQRDNLESAISSLLDELIEGKGSKMWFDEEKAIKIWDEATDISSRDEASSGITEISPIQLDYLDEKLMVEIPSLSDGYDYSFGAYDAAAFIRREEEKLIDSGEDDQVQQAKLDRRAIQQKTAIDKFIARSAISQELGKAIQENWGHVEEIMMQFKQAIEQDTWQDVAKKIRSVVWIDRLDPKKQTFVAFLPDEEGEPGASITLEVNKSVHQNAQRYFEDARTQRGKAKGAENALLNTRQSHAKEEKRIAKDVAAGKVRFAKRSKRFWFEKHRWAMLPGGHLLIGGRDAKGNDAIVKKHLTSNDMYVHADLHGAPSCSLKLKDGFSAISGMSNLPEGVVSLQIVQNLGEGCEDARDLDETIHAEAAQIATCWSRAWGSGRAAATAFHVRPSQVSKKTESGESLGRGSFVVRGTRNWHRDLPLEIGIGIGVINGIPLPICGTPKTISEHFPRWAKISAGQEKKESVANRIAKSTGLAQDDVLSALPPGNCSVEDYNLIGS